MHTQQRTSHRHSRESGQVIVIMVFAVVALAAFVGLAIDGGRLYSMRRQAQNAADAAAVAGARELALMIANCQPGEVANNYLVGRAVLEFSEHNGVTTGTEWGHVTGQYVDANGTELGPVGTAGGTIPNGATGVRVSLAMTETTSFMRIVGIRHISAPAVATAMAGPITELAGGLLPIAVPEKIVDELDPGESFVMKDNTGAFCRRTDLGEICLGADEEGTIPANSQRGWLNLSYIYNEAYWDAAKPPNRVFASNSGNNDCKWNGDVVDVAATGLKGWASGDCPYPHSVIAGASGSLGGDFITGIPGSNTSAIRSIEEGYDIGDLVYLPVFDYIYAREDMADPDVFQDKEPDIKWIGGNYYYYHIIGFVAAELQDINVTPHKTIDGTFRKLIVGEGKVVPGTGIGTVCPENATLFGVKLWD